MSGCTPQPPSLSLSLCGACNLKSHSHDPLTPFSLKTTPAARHTQTQGQVLALTTYTDSCALYN